MRHNPKDNRPDHATREDVERAVESLAPVDERRLERAARYRIRGLGRKAMYRDHEDLLRDAITATFIGAADPTRGRRWRKCDVSFVQHILGAMRSIASHWRESAEDDEAALDSDLTRESQDGEVVSIIESAESGAPDQERSLGAKEELARIHRLFQGDEDAALVIEDIKERWTSSEIIEQLGLTKNRYEAAMKRIRYHLDRGSYD